jgi:hypothetical protein
MAKPPTAKKQAKVAKKRAKVAKAPAKTQQRLDIGQQVLDARKRDLGDALRALALGKRAHPPWHVGPEDAAEIFSRVLSEAPDPQKFLKAVVNALKVDEIDACMRCTRIIDRILAALASDHPLHATSVERQLRAEFGLQPAFLPAGARVHATRLPTLDRPDLPLQISGNASRPIEQRHVPLLAPNRREIRVGWTEETRHGQLRCFLTAKTICVALFRGEKIQMRALHYVPADPALRKEGARIPEVVFGCAVREITCSPWHDGVEGDTLWTVHGLRTKGTLEQSADANMKGSRPKTRG